MCSQHDKAPIFPTSKGTTLTRLPPEESPKTVRSMCVGFNFLLRILISPFSSIVHCAIYREDPSLSESPRTTTILFSAAHWQIARISAESIPNEFWMYSMASFESTGLDLGKVSFSRCLARALLLQTHQIHVGYPGTQHSGNATRDAPSFAASAISAQVFFTDSARSSHAGSAWTTATRTDFPVITALRLRISRSYGL